MVHCLNAESSEERVVYKRLKKLAGGLGRLRGPILSDIVLPAARGRLAAGFLLSPPYLPPLPPLLLLHSLCVCSFGRSSGCTACCTWPHSPGVGAKNWRT